MKSVFITLFLLQIFNSYSQDLISNIDSLYLKSSLKVLENRTKVFNNGDSITFVRDFNKYNEFIDINRPAYTIITKFNKDFYFYNYRALTDKRGLFPIGFKIPTMNDLYSIEKNIKAKRFKINFIGYIDDAGHNPEDGNIQHFWLKDNFSLNEKTKIFIVNNIQQNFSIDTSSIYKDWGLPILLVEDVNSKTFDRIFPYDSLMPNQTRDLINSLKQSLILSINQNVRVNLNGKIEFGLNGLNKSKLNTIKISSGSTLEIVELSKKLNLKLLSLETPIYQGNYLLAQKNLAIDFSITQTSKRDEGFYSFYFFDENKVSSDLKNNLILADAQKFRCIKRTKNITFTINGELISEPNKNYITRFIPLGPIYSFYSIIPGGGILKVDQTRKHYPGAKMIHFSIPIGTIALGSFLYSNYQYNNYKSSLDPSVFSRANSMHKVFLSALSTYAILGVIDFTRTFIKGVDNVKLARKINKEIKEKHNGGLLF